MLKLLGLLVLASTSIPAVAMAPQVYTPSPQSCEPGACPVLSTGLYFTQYWPEQVIMQVYLPEIAVGDVLHIDAACPTSHNPVWMPPPQGYYSGFPYPAFTNGFLTIGPVDHSWPKSPWFVPSQELGITFDNDPGDTWGNFGGGQENPYRGHNMSATYVVQPIDVELGRHFVDLVLFASSYDTWSSSNFLLVIWTQCHMEVTRFPAS